MSKEKKTLRHRDEHRPQMETTQENNLKLLEHGTIDLPLELCERDG